MARRWPGGKRPCSERPQAHFGVSSKRPARACGLREVSRWATATIPTSRAAAMPAVVGVRKLEPFDWFRYHGDPVPALAVCRATKSIGLDHASLSALNAGYCAILHDEGTAVTSKLGMVCDLLRRNGGDTAQVGERESAFPGLAALVTASRGEWRPHAACCRSAPRNCR